MPVHAGDRIQSDGVGNEVPRLVCWPGKSGRERKDGLNQFYEKESKMCQVTRTPSAGSVKTDKKERNRKLEIHMGEFPKDLEVDT